MVAAEADTICKACAAALAFDVAKAEIERLTDGRFDPVAVRASRTKAVALLDLVAVVCGDRSPVLLP